MGPAKWKKAVFSNFKLYAVTDLKSDDPMITDRIEAAYRGGVDIVQLRSKELSDAVLYRLGCKIRVLADRYKKLFFVNDRLDLALAVKADGLHLGQEDLPVPRVRKLARRIGFDLWIGKSTHSLGQADAAQKELPDYIGVGPVFQTPTKAHYPPVGVDLVRQVSARVRCPVVAIGGIDETNIRSVLEAGARRIAVVRAVFGAEEVESAAKKLRGFIEEFQK